MNRQVRLLLGITGSLVLLMTSTPGLVHCDGIAIVKKVYKVEMPSQQAIIVWDEDRGHEDLILSVELLGSPEGAWVVPVPALPEVQAASADWFEMLADLTRPEIEERIVYTPGIIVGEEAVVDESVKLLSREEVGVYDVSILSADEPGALLEWLNDNGYAFPENGGPILDAYVEESGWYFVAARVLPGESDQLAGDVHPLWFSFDTEQPIYPMRLTALLEEPVDVLIYVLADHCMETRPHPFRRQFAGELKLDSPASEDNADLRELLSHRRYYVTKLRHGSLRPHLMTEDFAFVQAESDEPYRGVIYQTRYVYRPLTEVTSEPTASAVPTERHNGQPSIDEDRLILGVGLGTLGVLVVLGLVWRARSRRELEDEEEV